MHLAQGGEVHVDLVAASLVLLDGRVDLLSRGAGVMHCGSAALPTNPARRGLGALLVLDLAHCAALVSVA